MGKKYCTTVESNDGGFNTRIDFAFGMDEIDAEIVVYNLREKYPDREFGSYLGDVWMGCQIDCEEGISLREFINRAYKEGVFFASTNLTIEQLNSMVAETLISEHDFDYYDDFLLDDNRSSREPIIVKRIAISD